MIACERRVRFNGSQTAAAFFAQKTPPTLARRSAFCRALQVDHLLLINDFSAMALGMTRLKPEDVRQDEAVVDAYLGATPHVA